MMEITEPISVLAFLLSASTEEETVNASEQGPYSYANDYVRLRLTFINHSGSPLWYLSDVERD